MGNRMEVVKHRAFTAGGQSIAAKMFDGGPGSNVTQCACVVLHCTMSLMRCITA